MFVVVLSAEPLVGLKRDVDRRIEVRRVVLSAEPLVGLKQGVLLAASKALNIGFQPNPSWV